VIAGLDTNVMCYALDEAYPEHEKVKSLLLDLSAESKIALNPTTIHETYHVLVFSQKWIPQEAAGSLKILLKNPFIELFNQTRKTSIIALNISVKYRLGGRDALIIVNFLANKIPILYTYDIELLKQQKITWKNTSLTFKDPTTKA
jgi:predicted nucleic acid-binding protein